MFTNVEQMGVSQLQSRKNGSYDKQTQKSSIISSKQKDPNQMIQLNHVHIRMAALQITSTSRLSKMIGLKMSVSEELVKSEEGSGGLPS